MTKEQALALASARLRLKQKAEPAPEPVPEVQQTLADKLYQEEPTGDLYSQPEFELNRRGVRKGVKDPIDAIGQMVNRDPAYLDKIRQQEEEYQAARAEQGRTGFDPNRLMGNAISTAVPGVGAARLAQPASMLGKVGLGSATGAGYGLLTPTQDEDFWPTKGQQAGIGAMFGGAIPGATGLAGKGAQWVDEITKPMYKKGIGRDVKKFVTEAAGDEREALIQALQKAKGNQTAGQAIARASSPSNQAGGQFVRLEKDLAKTTQAGVPLKERYAQQAAERSAVIDSIARSPSVLKSAKKARDASSKQNYTAAYQQKPKITEQVTLQASPKPTGIVDASGKPIMGAATTRKVTRLEKEFRDILDDPFIKKAIPTANNLAKTEGFTLKSNPTKYIHKIKIGLDKQLMKTGDDALSNSERRAVQVVKDKLLAYAEKKNNLYEVARAQFAKQSIPINRMEVGGQLRKGLVNASEAETPTAYLNAMREAPRTLKRATGFKRYDELGDVLSPDQVSGANKVKDALVNQAKAKRMAADSESIIASLPSEIEFSLPRLLSRPIVIANAALRAIGKDKSMEYKALMVDIMKDPKKLEAALQLPASNPKLAMAKDIAQQITTLGTVKAATQENR